MKKILFVPWTLSLGGGSEKILLNIINNIPSDKYEISILEIERGKYKSTFNENVKRIDFIFKDKITGYKVFDKISRKIKFLLIKHFPNIISKFYIKEKFDIVISFNYLYPSFLIQNLNCKKIAWVHGSIEDLDFLDSTGSKRVELEYLYNIQKKAFKNIDSIVAISNKTEKSILNIYPQFSSKISKIYNGYEFKEIELKSKEKNVDDIDIIAIGRLDKNKNFSLLIEVIKEVKKSIPNIKVKILGDGDEREILNNLIKEYQLEQNIELLGYVKNPYPYIKASKLISLTSKSEGFPTVLVEAMYLMCPFISTEVGGVDELSNNGQCGMIANNKAEFIKNVQDILLDNNKMEIMKVNCNEYVKKFSMEKQIDEILKIIE